MFIEKWIITTFGREALVRIEDTVTALGTFCIGGIILIFCLAKGFRSIKTLPSDYARHFLAVRHKTDGQPESILVKRPHNYAESVDLVVTVLAMVLLGRQHMRHNIIRRKYIVYILITIGMVLGALAIYLIITITPLD